MVTWSIAKTSVRRGKINLVYRPENLKEKQVRADGFCFHFLFFYYDSPCVHMTHMIHLTLPNC